MAGIEFLRIDNSTTIPNLKNELRRNEVYYMLAKGL
jgi:L-arabinose isomerase